MDVYTVLMWESTDWTTRMIKTINHHYPQNWPTQDQHACENVDRDLPLQILLFRIVQWYLSWRGDPPWSCLLLSPCNLLRPQKYASRKSQGSFVCHRMWECNISNMEHIAMLGIDSSVVCHRMWECNISNMEHIAMLGIDTSVTPILMPTFWMPFFS